MNEKMISYSRHTVDRGFPSKKDRASSTRYRTIRVSEKAMTTYLPSITTPPVSLLITQKSPCAQIDGNRSKYAARYFVRSWNSSQISIGRFRASVLEFINSVQSMQILNICSRDYQEF